MLLLMITLGAIVIGGSLAVTTSNMSKRRY